MNNSNNNPVGIKVKRTRRIAEHNLNIFIMRTIQSRNYNEGEDGQIFNNFLIDFDVTSSRAGCGFGVVATGRIVGVESHGLGDLFVVLGQLFVHGSGDGGG